jgi:hypothetical protein
MDYLSKSQVFDDEVPQRSVGMRSKILTTFHALGVEVNIFRNHKRKRFVPSNLFSKFLFSILLGGFVWG